MSETKNNVIPLFKVSQVKATGLPWASEGPAKLMDAAQRFIGEVLATGASDFVYAGIVDGKPFVLSLDLKEAPTEPPQEAG